MKRFLNVTLLLTLLAFMGTTMQSCKSSQDSAASKNAIAGTWILTSLNGEKASDAFKGKIPTMTIDLSSKRISGNSGCNQYTGGFTYSKGILSAPKLAGTMMACMEANMEYEFNQMLGQDNTVSVVGNILTLSQGGKTVATFEKGLDLGALTGEWTLESIAGESINTLFANGKYPTLVFDTTEKRISGNGGCNRYNTTYKVEGTKITFGPVMSTRMACDNLSGENKYTSTLSGESELTITKGGFTLSKDGKVVLTFARKVAK